MKTYDKIMTSHHPDFTTYTLKDLHRAKHSLDPEVFPADAQRLDAEINKRLQPPTQSHESDLAEPVPDTKRRLSFTRFIHSRGFVMTAFIILNFVIITDIINKLPVTPLTQTHKYIAEPDSAYCQKYQEWDDFGIWVGYELEVTVGDYLFTAINLSKTACQKIANKLSHPAEVAIWHDNFFIYQLGENGDIHPYETQAKLVGLAQHEGLGFHYVVLIFLWILGFYLKKS